MGSVLMRAMGYLLSFITAEEDEWEVAREDDPNRPPFLHELPLDERRRIQQRLFDEEERKYPHRFVRRPRTAEERNASITRPHVYNALRHYNSNNPGGEFDPVKPLTSARVGFRDEVWFHINFLARRRNSTDDSVQRFFAELHYDWYDIPVVETCTILPQGGRFRSKCAFCRARCEILHPTDGEFVCGNKNQKKGELSWSKDIALRPFCAPHDGTSSC